MWSRATTWLNGRRTGLTYPSLPNSGAPEHSQHPDAAVGELDGARGDDGPLRGSAGRVLGGDHELVAVGPRRTRQLHLDRLGAGVQLDDVAVVDQPPPGLVAVPDPASVEVHADGLEAGVEPLRGGQLRAAGAEPRQVTGAAGAGDLVALEERLLAEDRRGPPQPDEA